MAANDDEELVRRHIYMYKRDMDTIEAIVARKTDTSKFIRKIVRNYLDRIREKAQEKRLQREGDEKHG
jgi:hypothetical protein